MTKILHISSILLFLLVLPIGVFYTLISGSVISDDAGIPAANPSNLMFVWHLVISILAVFVMSMSIISKVKASPN